MSAGYQQQKIRKIELISQPGGEGVPFEMVDSIKRLARRQSERLGGHQSDNQPTDQAGACGCSNGIDLIKLHASLTQSLLDKGIEGFNMGAGGYFRHHTTIRLVFSDLAEHNIGQDATFALIIAFDDSVGCFVAARLYSKNAHLRLAPACHIISGNRVSWAARYANGILE